MTDKPLGTNVYSTKKIFAHPQVIEKINRSEQVAPIMVHMMWQNLCNHDCEFCSYRRSGNKNNEMFSDKQYIPLEKMLETLKDLKEMGTKALEITGGGEPTIYPHFLEGVRAAVDYGFDLGIVSNGSSFREEFIEAMAPNLLWARISVDSGSVDDYTRVRRVGAKHWDRAWRAVANLRKHGRHHEFTLGVGFVVTHENYRGLKEAVRLAKENGAHNVRISAAFTEKQLGYYGIGPNSAGMELPEAIRVASRDASEAKELYEDSGFKVFNLFDERINNMVVGKQDYNMCMAKEVVCVIGGDSKVYTCCSLAFNHKGLVGDISDKSFKDMWFSEETQKLFRTHDPREICNVMCLYEERNKNFLAHRHEDASSVLGGVVPKHKNYI